MRNESLAEADEIDVLVSWPAAGPWNHSGILRAIRTGRFDNLQSVSFDEFPEPIREQADGGYEPTFPYQAKIDGCESFLLLMVIRLVGLFAISLHVRIADQSTDLPAFEVGVPR